jgi:citrate lyase subunit beta/citryl-CoA lyase
VKLDPDICRSLLFVPAGNERFVNSALRGAADVIQIDLEDAIAPDQKDSARDSARSAVEEIDAAGRVAAVRVNVDDGLLEKDLQAVVYPGLAALTVPKVDSGAMLASLDSAVTKLEAERGLASGSVRLIAQIETAKGILNAREIAGASARLAAMGVGMEDLIADVGGTVAADALYFPSMQVLYAAREVRVVPIGYLGSIAVYRDTERFTEWVVRAKSLGFEGGFCIHPNQVEILNDTLRPSIDEVSDAQALVDVADAHAGEGVGAFAYQGRMVDAPVIERARRTLRRHATFS